MEIETIKKSQKETTLVLENLGNRTRVIDGSISNRIEEMEDRISGAEGFIENMDTKIKENSKCKKDTNSKHPGNPGHNEKIKPTDNRSRCE